MAKRRGSSASPNRRSTGYDRSADRWLPFVGLAAIIVLLVGLIGPWPEPVGQAGVAPLTMAEARASNAAEPIESDRRVTALPYRFGGGRAERAQAAECLATAALYEAGDDLRGQRAVIQVILNRVRAPGFPKTVCGVVYQGHERATGCQFSFTCDGSVRRRPVHFGWTGARQRARQALAGHVVAAIGRATHYHADWVVPYWRGSMVKVAQVGSHLFYVRS